MHRDLKPENVLLQKLKIKGTDQLSDDYKNFTLKLGDFGLSQSLERNILNKCCILINNLIWLVTWETKTI